MHKLFSHLFLVLTLNIQTEGLYDCSNKGVVSSSYLLLIQSWMECIDLLWTLSLLGTDDIIPRMSKSNRITLWWAYKQTGEKTEDAHKTVSMMPKCSHSGFVVHGMTCIGKCFLWFLGLIYVYFNSYFLLNTGCPAKLFPLCFLLI